MQGEVGGGGVGDAGLVGGHILGGGGHGVGGVAGERGEAGQGFDDVGMGGEARGNGFAVGFHYLVGLVLDAVAFGAGEGDVLGFALFLGVGGEEVHWD